MKIRKNKQVDQTYRWDTEGRPSSIVQTIIFPKEFWTMSKAKAWLKKHKFKYGKVDEKVNTLRFRQVNPEFIGKETYRTIKFGDKIKAVIGIPTTAFWS